MSAAGGTSEASAADLPPEGIDLRAEITALQSRRVAQALARADGDATVAAKLLRVTRLDLARMQAGVSAMAWSRSTPKPAPVQPDEVPNIRGGVEVITRAAVRRLHHEGRTPDQIAKRLGVNAYAIEKILRAEAEIAKCGAEARPAPAPERWRGV